MDELLDGDILELLVRKIERVILKELVKDTERLVDPDELRDLFGVTVPFGHLVNDL